MLLGYSDLTTLQIWLTARAGVVAFQAPMLEGRLARGAEGYDREALLRVVCTPVAAGDLPAPGLDVAARPATSPGRCSAVR